MDDETMSCVVYGDEERGGYDSPYCGTLSPMSSADYSSNAGYWDNPPDTGYFVRLGLLRNSDTFYSLDGMCHIG